MSKQTLHLGPSFTGRGFRKASIAACALFGIGLLTSIFFLFQASSQDQSAYMTLMLESNPHVQPKGRRSVYTASQERTHIKKELTFLSNDQRLELQLRARHSTLWLHQHATGTELIEEMTDVRCYMQEGLSLLPGSKKTNTSQGGASMQMIRVAKRKKLIIPIN